MTERAEAARAADRAETGPGASLIDRLTPMITRTLGILDVLRSNGSHPTAAADIYRELFNSLRHFRDGALKAGKPESETYDAIFAVAAWADEAFGAYPDWCTDVTALTATLFKSTDPAADFAGRLKRLTDAQNEAREVFLIVLGLGYQGGRGADGQPDPARARELARLKMQQAARHRPPPLPPSKVDANGLTPAVYQLTDAPAYAPPQPRGGRLAWAGGLALLLLAGAGAGLWAVFGGAGGAETGGQLVATAEGPENEVLALLLEGFDCARVSASQGAEGRVQLSGFVASAADLRALETSVASLEAVQSVASTVAVRPWPFCAALSVLVDFGPHGGGMGGATAGGAVPDYAPPTIEFADGAGPLVEGQPLVFTVTASPDFDGYLYVDYIDAEGGVIHMLPEPLHPDNIVYSGEPVQIGLDPVGAGINDRIWRVTPPLGTRMILALSSPVPLFADFRPVEEDAADYLPELRETLTTTRNLGGALAYPGAYLFFETVPAATE
ncbi:MAG: DUF4384 domain-containing protein [Alphaproteobacteria bacterium]|jgi:type VI protein secretion system component VasF|nr:DUF4384 domain-containing protein [Alphaproteobacteria bacterium]